MTMKANELRIGNLIQELDYTIIQLDYDIIYELIEGIKELDYYEPIPLTEEWLLKFGFTNYEWCDDCAFIKIHGGHLMARLLKGKWILTKTRVTKDRDGHMTNGHDKIVKDDLIKHVHQLQNLYFSLTGEELEIKE